MKPEEIKQLQEENASLRKENEQHVADFVALDEKNKELEKALAAATNEPQKKKPIKVAVSWKTPQGKEMKKKVTITIGNVRIPSQDYPVSTEGFLKVCTGKTLSDDEKSGLEGLTKEAALELLTKWTQIEAGFIAE